MCSTRDCFRRLLRRRPIPHGGLVPSHLVSRSTQSRSRASLCFCPASLLGLSRSSIASRSALIAHALDSRFAVPVSAAYTFSIPRSCAASSLAWAASSFRIARNAPSRRERDVEIALDGRGDFVADFFKGSGRPPEVIWRNHVDRDPVAVLLQIGNCGTRAQSVFDKVSRPLFDIVQGRGLICHGNVPYELERRLESSPHGFKRYARLRMGKQSSNPSIGAMSKAITRALA